MQASVQGQISRESNIRSTSLCPRCQVLLVLSAFGCSLVLTARLTGSKL